MLLCLRYLKCVLSLSLSIIAEQDPPPSPPKITIQGQTYQGVNEDNIASLAEGYTGEATCSVEGGYPDAHSTQLRCGQLVSSGGGSSAALTFTTTPLSRDMSGTVCTCTAQHDSGCYEKMASVTLRIVCEYWIKGILWYNTSLWPISLTCDMKSSRGQGQLYKLSFVYISLIHVECLDRTLFQRMVGFRLSCIVKLTPFISGIL